MTKCPHCGYCEHCGRSNQPFNWPKWYPNTYPQPYWKYGTYTSKPYTTIGGNKITVNGK